jgi:biopolymer transport protein ExbD
MEETEVSLDQLATSLPQLLAVGNIERVYIRADSLAHYGPVLQTMAIALNSGVPWSLVAEPYHGER